MRYLNGMFFGAIFCFATTLAMAGQLDSPATPTDPASAMYTMEDVYNRIDDGTEGTKRGGAFTEPSAGPAPTGKTLDDLYNLASERSHPAKSGQTIVYATGDDGDLRKGVTWPAPRFTDNSDGTVTDNLTGLIWLKNADCFGMRNWATALSDCNNLASGSCGLTDGSSAGVWRLPNAKELFSLIDLGQKYPALPSGYPFTGVHSWYCWSSTTDTHNTEAAWSVYLPNGGVGIYYKTSTYYVWPICGGQ